MPRHRISWGHFAMVEAELELLRAAVPGGYDYYHLLSGVDVPVKTRAYIENYFTRAPGRNYVSSSLAGDFPHRSLPRPVLATPAAL